MADHNCATCRFRARYDERPKSMVGRIWRWHTNFCPGWKAYMKSLPDDERQSVEKKYGFRADKFAEPGGRATEPTNS